MNPLDESSSMSTEDICVERGGLGVFLDERARSLKNEAYVILRRNVEASVIKEREAKGFFSWSVLTWLPKNGKRCSVLEHHLAKLYCVVRRSL